MHWNAQPESWVDKCVLNSDKRGDTIETNGKECPSDYTKVGSRAKEMVSIFTIKGPTQLSVQCGLLKPSIAQGECSVEETYLRSRTEHILPMKWGCILHSPTGPDELLMDSCRLLMDSCRLLMDSWWTPAGLLMNSCRTPDGLLVDSWWTPEGLLTELHYPRAI